MPYSTLASLPSAVRKLATHAQEIWRKAWNNAYKQYKDEATAFRVAWSAVRKWQQEKFHPTFQRILFLFQKRFKDSADEKFYGFLTSNDLNPEKRYHPKVQFRENFSWVRPLIQYYKKDENAKYYKILCLTANMSMNKNDYSDYEKMQKAAPTMNYRPVNVNHNHNKWLPYPRTRMDFAVADELAVEGTLRVDNRDKWLQDGLDKGKYKHPSIEGRPIPVHMGGGYSFTGLAILEKGVQLPGDPLTYIEPLFLNESLGKSTCKLINGKLVCDNQNEGEINMQENLRNQVDHPTDPPLPKSCVCSKCGIVVDNPKKHCEVLLCSACQHQMKVNPKQNQPQPTGGKGHLPPAKIEAISIDELKAKIAELIMQKDKLDQQLYPRTAIPKVTKEEKRKIQNQIELLRVEIDAYKKALGDLIARQNIEEIYNWIPKEALWDTKYKNDLPDTSFAVVLAGGKKDEAGKTVPRSLRKLPYKNAAGAVDRPHLAAALQAIRGARVGTVPPYAAKAKPVLCRAAVSINLKSTVCGTAESVETEDELFKLFKEQAKTDEQRAMTHFKIAPAAWAKLSDEEKQVYIKKLPARGAGGSTQELFREPLGTTGQANKRFKTAQDTMKSKDGVPPFREKFLAEEAAHAKTREKLIEAENSLSAKEIELNKKIIEFQRKISDLNKKLAAWENKDASFAEMQEQFSKLQDEYKQLLDEKLKIVDQNSELKTEVKALKKTKGRQESTITEHENESAKTKAIIEDLREKLQKLRTDFAAARQDTRNEISNRAKIQTENADLREKNAELARDISNLTEKRLEEAKTIQKLQGEVIEVRKDNENLKTANEALEKVKKAAIIRSKQTINEMKKAGYVRLQKS